MHPVARPQSAARPSSARSTVLSSTSRSDTKPVQAIPPGYGGFIANSQYHHGKTFGNLVRMSDDLNSDYSVMRDPLNFEEVPIPKTDGSKAGIRGYTGYCPRDVREDVGNFKITGNRTTTPRVSVSSQEVRTPPRTYVRPSSAPVNINVHYPPPHKSNHRVGLYHSSKSSQGSHSHTTSADTRDMTKSPALGNRELFNTGDAWGVHNDKLFESRVPPKSSRNPGYAGYISGEKFDTIDSNSRRKVTEDKRHDLVDQTSSSTMKKEIPEYLCYLSMNPEVNPFAKDMMSRYTEPSKQPVNTLPADGQRPLKKNSWAAFVNSRDEATLKPTVRSPAHVPLIQNHIKGYAGFVPGNRFA